MPKFMAQIDANQIPIKGIVVEASSTAPTGPVNGQLWYDTTGGVNKLKAYQNGAWVILDTDTNTTYANGSTALIAAGSDVVYRVWTPADLKAGIVANSPVASVAGRTGVVVLTKTDVGLANVDNTTDANKPVSSATQTALNTKAPLASPAFTGVPTTTTPSANDNTTKIPTTAWVQTEITSLGSAFQAAIDTAVQGLDAKVSVRAASTANIASMSGTGFSVDSVTLVVGDRVLVKNQTLPAQNGIYIVQSGAWSRALDMNSWAEAVSAFVFVEEGLQNADSGWVVSSNGAGTIGTTDLLWTQFSQAGIVTAGAGITKTGNVISVQTEGIITAMLADLAVDNDKLNTNAVSTLKIQDSAVTEPKINNGAVNLTSKVSGVLPIANGGTNAANKSSARTNLAAGGIDIISLPSLTAGTWTDIPNGPIYNGAGGSLIDMPNISFRIKTTYEAVVVDYRVTAAGSIQVKADVSVGNGDIVATIVGNSATRLIG